MPLISSTVSYIFVYITSYLIKLKSYIHYQHLLHVLNNSGVFRVCLHSTLQESPTLAYVHIHSVNRETLGPCPISPYFVVIFQSETSLKQEVKVFGLFNLTLSTGLGEVGFVV